MNQLAIVIPAYKIDYFEETIQSIAQQTNRNFVVYIGIDASPYDFESIINKYSNIINIKYTRFTENLGGRDLVAHWERCMQLIADEEWIWLFSDDDIMQPNCVKNFFSTVQAAKDNAIICNIYHFDVMVIDGNSNVVRKSPSYPDTIASYDFYNQKMQNKLDSFVVENIFRRSRYKENNGFVNFDCAWGADTASWIAFMGNHSMQTIIGESKILWRQSDKNISPDNGHIMALRKVRATMEYFDWSFTFFAQYKSIKLYNLIYILQRLSYYAKYLNMDEIKINTSHILAKHYSYPNIIYRIIAILSKLKKINVGI